MKLALIGYPYSGKLHFAALLYLHLQRIAGKDLYVRTLIENPTHNVVANAERLRRGEPLLHPIIPKLFEDHFIISCPRLFGNKTLDIVVINPMWEIPIEIVIDIIEILSRKQTINYINYREFEERLKEMGITSDEIRAMHENIFGADAYVFIVNIAAEAGRSDEVERLERAGLRGANVGYVRFLDILFAYRIHNRFGRIAGAAIVLTKYDKIMDMSITPPEGMSLEQYLVNKYLPVFKMVLEGFLREHSKRKDLPIFLTWTMMDETGRRFLLTEDRQGFVMPKYSEEAFDKFINWVKNL